MFKLLGRIELRYATWIGLKKLYKSSLHYTSTNLMLTGFFIIIFAFVFPFLLASTTW